MRDGAGGTIRCGKERERGGGVREEGGETPVENNARAVRLDVILAASGKKPK